MPIYYSLATPALPAPSTFCSRIFMTWPPPPGKATTVSAVYAHFKTNPKKLVSDYVISSYTVCAMTIIP